MNADAPAMARSGLEPAIGVALRLAGAELGIELLAVMPNVVIAVALVRLV